MYREYKLKREEVRQLMSKKQYLEKQVSPRALDDFKRKPFQLEYQERYGAKRNRGS